MEVSFAKGRKGRKNAWGHCPGAAGFLTKFSIILHARAARGRFGPLQRFFDELEPGRHKSHVLTDLKRGAEFLSVMGITLENDEWGFKVSTACGFSEYLSKKKPKKKKEVKREKFKRQRSADGRFFWEKEGEEGYGEAEVGFDGYKSFL